MSTRNRVKTTTQTTRRGLDFAQAPVVVLGRSDLPIKDAGVLLGHAREYDRDTEYVDARELLDRGMDLDATVAHGYRLTEDAFADIAHIAKAPPEYLKQVAARNEDLGLALIEDTVRRMPQGYVAQVHRGNVLGVRGAGTLAVELEPLVKTVLVAAGNTGRVTRAEMRGTSFSLSTVTKEATVGPKAKGDVVGFGAVVLASLTRKATIKVAGYQHRLVCLNGAVRESAGGTILLDTVGSDYAEVGALLHIADQQSTEDLVVMEKAQTTYLPHKEEVLDALYEGAKAIVDPAIIGHIRRDDLIMAEAHSDSRNDATAWDFFNAVTSTVRDLPDPASRFKQQARALDLLPWLVEQSNNLQE